MGAGVRGICGRVADDGEACRVVTGNNKKTCAVLPATETLVAFSKVKQYLAVLVMLGQAKQNLVMLVVLRTAEQKGVTIILGAENLINWRLTTGKLVTWRLAARTLLTKRTACRKPYELEGSCAEPCDF